MSVPNEPQSISIEFPDPFTGERKLEIRISRGTTRMEAMEMLRLAAMHIDENLPNTLLEEAEWEKSVNEQGPKVVARLTEPIRPHADSVEDARRIVQETILNTTRRLRVMGFSSVVAATYDDPLYEENHVVGSYRGNVFTCLGLATHLRDDVRRFIDMGGRALRP
jgi:hypothetical protein